MFSHIFGNEPIKAYLQKALSENRLPQTLLFTGLDGIGKRLFAEKLAHHLLKSDRSPDLHILAPEGKSGFYAIDTVREMIDKEHSAPFEAPGKVFILEDAERMQPASANALLKTLEEPSPDTTFILLSTSSQEMLPTILSRCVILSFQPLTQEAIEMLLLAKGHPVRLAKLAQGSAGRAFELAEKPELEELRKIIFSLLAEKPSFPDLSLQIEKLEELIEEGKEENPVQVGRRVEYLFASILMWHRDQELRQLGERQDLLFFPEEGTHSPIAQIEKAIEKARLAYQRNIKLSVLMEQLLLP